MNKTFSLDSAPECTDLGADQLGALAARLQSLEIPAFASYAPDLAALAAASQRYRGKKHVIVEGNGGSMSTLRAFVSCFGDRMEQDIHLLDTSDPDAVARIQARCPAADSVLIVVSKSGESIDAIAAVLALREYETVFVTGESGALYELARTQGIPELRHPDISGRYSGLTECALLPAAVLGLDTAELVAGAQDMYRECAPQAPFASNPALQLAASLDKLEKEGYTTLFLSMYSRKLAGFFELITQLFHEGVCKEGLGQTIYGGEAPENQHHTLQRFNSGRQDSVGIFLTADSGAEVRLAAPENIRAIRCRNLTLGQLDGVSLGEVLHTEFQGTWQDTVEKGIPAFHLHVGEINPRTVGRLIAFWQYAAFYSSVLREVNPFNQPGVERSKQYIFELLEKR